MRNFGIIRLILIIALLFNSAVLASAFEPVEKDLRGMWKFRIGDHKEWSSSSYDDSGWEDIRVPARWEDEGFRGYDGYAWYRNSVVFPEEMKQKSLVLELGYIDDADEVYINGVKIGQTGSFPPRFSTAYTALRKYNIPNEVIHFGEKNLIAVRVYDAMLDGGIVSGNLRIYSSGNLPPFDINLTGVWQFNKGRSIDEYRTEPIQVPGFWENQGYNGYDGYAVYSKKIIVSEKLASQRLVLLAGRIDDTDMVFINGKYVGQTGSFNEWTGDYYREFRNYFIPPNRFKPGENILEIRVHDSGGDGGISQGPVGIMTQDQFREYWKSKRKN